MTETGGLSRKKKVRAAHRASVTRMIDQVQERLSSGEGLNAAKQSNRNRTVLRLKREIYFRIASAFDEKKGVSTIRASQQKLL